MSSLYIPNSIALRNFDSIFTRNDFNFSDKKVDISFHPKYVAMHPVGLAFYAAIGDMFTRDKIETSAEINYKIRSIPYLQRMGLFSALGYDNPVPTQEHEATGRFIPLQKIVTNNDLGLFLKTVDPILHTTSEKSRVIKHAFSEMLRNVLEHAKAEYGGNVCATYNRKRKKISIGISDAGIGIPKSILRYHHVKDSIGAITKALTPGITGTTKNIGGTSENAGAGLFFTKCIAQSTRNHFLIYSGDAYFKLLTDPLINQIEFKPDPTKDHATLKSGLPYFQGTLIGIDIQIADTAVFNKLIESIGKAYSKGVKKSKTDYYKRIKFT